MKEVVIDKENGAFCVNYNRDSINTVEAADLYLSTKEDAVSFFNEVFWRAIELANGYLQKKMTLEMLPILYDFKKAVWYIDLLFLMECLGAEIDKKLGTDFKKEFYSLAENGLRNDTDLSTIRQIMVGKLELEHKIMSMNDYTTYSKKSHKINISPKFYAVKIAEKLDVNNEKEEVVINILPIINGTIVEMINENILQDLMERQLLMQNKITKKTFYEYKTEREESMKLLKYYGYPMGNYDKYKNDY